MGYSQEPEGCAGAGQLENNVYYYNYILYPKGKKKRPVCVTAKNYLQPISFSIVTGSYDSRSPPSPLVRSALLSSALSEGGPALCFMLDVIRLRESRRRALVGRMGFMVGKRTARGVRYCCFFFFFSGLFLRVFSSLCV